MCMRVSYNVWFIAKFFGQACAVGDGVSTGAGNETAPIRWEAALPPVSLLAAFVASFAVTAVSATYLDGSTHSLAHKAMHVCVGAACFGVAGALLWRHDRHFVRELRTLLRRRPTSETDACASPPVHVKSKKE
eukprot:TRINITY_DN7414_c0_g1_i2.p3 TRINITY_DN7414_c0_g1~~TRINITY_DN7414_c0_g1_i2.p3  ORF type:complete len:133 (+),score=17.80 TRINITY_DN7414_c0_g1_i2:301-699(+)